MKLKKIFDKIQKIETKNLILREIQVKDAKDFFEYYTSEKICKYLDWNGPKSLEEAKSIYILGEKDMKKIGYFLLQ